MNYATFAKFPSMKPGDLVGHRFARPKGLMHCEFMLVIIFLSSIKPQKLSSLLVALILIINLSIIVLQ